MSHKGGHLYQFIQFQIRAQIGYPFPGFSIQHTFRAGMMLDFMDPIKYQLLILMLWHTLELFSTAITLIQSVHQAEAP